MLSLRSWMRTSSPPDWILEHEGLAQADRLAVDLEHPLALVVLDPEVVTDGEQLLAHEKALASGLVVATS